MRTFATECPCVLSACNRAARGKAKHGPVEIAEACAALPHPASRASPAHELAAVDAAMADEEAPLAPVVPKKKAGGRLPTGWFWDEAQGLYVNTTTLETSVDQPYDRCGTLGCILRDKQCIRGIEPLFASRPH